MSKGYFNAVKEYSLFTAPKIQKKEFKYSLKTRDEIIDKFHSGHSVAYLIALFSIREGCSKITARKAVEKMVYEELKENRK